MKRQHVDFVILVECAELHPRDYADAQPLARLARCWNSSDRIVVSECERLEAAALGSVDYPLWQESAV